MILKKENAKHIVTFNEAIPIKTNNQGVGKVLKIIVCAVVGVLCVGTVISGDNLFLELNSMGLITLICLLIGMFFSGKTQLKAEPMEIWFFNDYLVMLKVKHYYSKKLSRKEYDKIYYKDIRNIKWDEVTQQVTFRGLFELEWYKYEKDGSVEPVPSYTKTVETMRCFYFKLCPEIDFLAIFKEYIPCNIDVKFKRNKI
ncbi:MAG: hypothetical protein R3Y35_07455 [Clostridia bacterium]